MTSGGPDKGPVATSDMVARPRELLREVREGKETVRALKAIKNQVIGNKFKKNAFVSEGAVEQVLEVLKGARNNEFASADQADVVQRQAAIVIGSLSLSAAGLQRLVNHEGLPLLVALLHSVNEAVVEAGLWAVKMAVQQSTCVPSYLISGTGENSASFADPLGAVLPTTTASAAATSAAGAAPVRLDAPAISAIVRCLAAGANPGASSGGDAAVASTSTDVARSNTSATGGGGVPAASAPLRPGRAAAISALAAAVVACCCRRDEERDLAIAAGAPEGLLRLLLESERPDTQVAALEGLSLMLPYQPSASALALARPEVYGRLFSLLRDPSPAVRLLAASCVATLSRVPGCQQSEAMQRTALPVLLRLLAQPATRPHVPAVLARLIEGSEQLQKAAADADTVRLLAGLLAAEAAAAPTTAAATAEAPPPPSSTAAAVPGQGGAVDGGSAAATPGAVSANARLREGCLRALSSLCLNRDDSRKQLLEAKVLRHIVRSLEDPHDGVRAAAALCVRALSRCVRTLRGGLLEGGGDLAPALVGLLADGNPDVQASAAGAVCNLVLDFSAAKSAVLAAGGLGRLVGLTASPQPSLRHHATWALGNLLFKADTNVRAQLMQALPWSRMRELLADSDPRVMEHALVILRNLCMGDKRNIAATLEWAGGGCGQQAVVAAPAALASGALASHITHSQGHSQGQRQQPVGSDVGGHEGLLDVLQARIMDAASASSTGREADDERGATASEECDRLGAAATAALPGAAASPKPSSAIAAGTHALYAVANLLTGGPALKDVVAARRSLLAAVAAHLRPAAGELALPAVWCAVNLTWPAGGIGSGGAEREGRPEQEAVAARCRALMEVGGAELLQELSRSHPLRDVQERATTALEQLRSSVPVPPGAALMLAV
ncbi:hypothetical protein PLESTB_001853800 [Pleodorina starrii]|uniref:Armadillo repeat-containing protein 8 n=1 Tax=Pleodorina starrii TaxID=330485 RepID=A0A9W6C1X0_9CHLO|nr:hypothetical protein PLESTM_000928200 [Pleodorina starrii]GLC62193.1 hypothetical protein PLESTB_001853800 [Pleodorina starrii]GLC69989.1 hypothetical protein PLESTF_000907300 [Pleodorina starrii]